MPLNPAETVLPFHLHFDARYRKRIRIAGTD